MTIIRNNIIPFKGFAAINIVGIVFARKDAYISHQTLNHEAIHTSQMRELAYIPFYILYLLEWIVRLFMAGNAYRNISFEREAYDNERNPEYVKQRKHYAWIRIKHNKPATK